MELETVNKLYLELSQFATATTSRELALMKELAEVKLQRDDLIADLSKAAPVAQKVPSTPPASFVEYMAKNYPPNTVIVDAAWHARPIWNAACHALQNCGLLAARNQPEKK